MRLGETTAVFCPLVAAETKSIVVKCFVMTNSMGKMKHARVLVATTLLSRRKLTRPSSMLHVPRKTELAAG